MGGFLAEGRFDDDFKTFINTCPSRCRFSRTLTGPLAWQNFDGDRG